MMLQQSCSLIKQQERTGSGGSYGGKMQVHAYKCFNQHRLTVWQSQLSLLVTFRTQ